MRACVARAGGGGVGSGGGGKQRAFDASTQSVNATNARKNVKRPSGGGGGCGAAVGAFTAGFTAGFTAVCVVAASGIGGGGGGGCEEVVAAREALQEPCGGRGGRGEIRQLTGLVSSSTL